MPEIFEQTSKKQNRSFNIFLPRNNFEFLNHNPSNDLNNSLLKSKNQELKSNLNHK